MINGAEDQMRQTTVPASFTSLHLRTLNLDKLVQVNWSKLTGFSNRALLCFPVNSVEHQAAPNKKCKPHMCGKKSKSLGLSTSMFSFTGKSYHCFLFFTLFCLWQKKGTQKRACLRNKLKMMMVSSLRQLTQMLLLSRRSLSAVLQKYL